MYERPAIVAPPATAVNVDNFVTSLGITRAKDIVRTAGRLCTAYAPRGQKRLLIAGDRTPFRNKPPAPELE